jgi:hypothetical protein
MWSVGARQECGALGRGRIAFRLLFGSNPTAAAADKPQAIVWRTCPAERFRWGQYRRADAQEAHRDESVQIQPHGKHPVPFRLTWTSKLCRVLTQNRRN